ncbi:hypothetical protein KKB44_06735 [Candidatus Micrarchaeota archaeon]|nr:hypothetical protein [Candidatus Micrarchaeota archaeon]
MNVDDISASAQTFSCASGMTILFVPVIFFLLILLSWAENRRQALCIALSYFLVGVSLGEINIESNIVAILGIIVCGSLFGILMRLIEKDKRRLALLVTVMILVYIYISNMTSKLFPMLFIEGILSLAITVMLLKLLTKLTNKMVLVSSILLLPLSLLIYGGMFIGMGAGHRVREEARKLGYTDMRLYRRDCDELRLKEELQEQREMISKYYQETGTYPSVLNEEIWFIWDDIPGEGDKLLKLFLEKVLMKTKFQLERGLKRKIELKTNWVKDADIKKNNDNKTITVTKEGSLIVLKLKKKINQVNVDFGDELGNEYGHHYGYSIKEENGKIYVYSTLNKLPDISPPETSHPDSNKAFIIRTKPNQKIQSNQITDKGGWIYSPDSGDIRINCNHKDSKGVPYYEW